MSINNPTWSTGDRLISISKLNQLSADGTNSIDDIHPQYSKYINNFVAEKHATSTSDPTQTFKKIYFNHTGSPYGISYKWINTTPFSDSSYVGGNSLDTWYFIAPLNINFIKLASQNSIDINLDLARSVLNGTWTMTIRAKIIEIEQDGTENILVTGSSKSIVTGVTTWENYLWLNNNISSATTGNMISVFLEYAYSAVPGIGNDVDFYIKDFYIKQS